MDCLLIVGVLQFLFGMKWPVSASDALIKAYKCSNSALRTLAKSILGNLNTFSLILKGQFSLKKKSPPTDCSVVYLSKLFCSSCFSKTRWSIKKCQVNCRLTPVSWPPAIGELCVMWHVLSVAPEWGEPWMSSVFIYKNRQFQPLFFQWMHQILGICNNDSSAQGMCNSCVPNHLLPLVHLNAVH